MFFRSDFLFSDTDFVTGMGTAVNIWGNFYEFAVSESEQRADAKALRADWGCVGRDIKKALVTCNQESIEQEEANKLKCAL